jgi:hypothetical protein
LNYLVNNHLTFSLVGYHNLGVSFSLNTPAHSRAIF